MNKEEFGKLLMVTSQLAKADISSAVFALYWEELKHIEENKLCEAVRYFGLQKQFPSVEQILSKCGQRLREPNPWEVPRQATGERVQIDSLGYNVAKKTPEEVIQTSKDYAFRVECDYPGNTDFEATKKHWDNSLRKIKQAGWILVQWDEHSGLADITATKQGKVENKTERIYYAYAVVVRPDSKILQDFRAIKANMEPLLKSTIGAGDRMFAKEANNDHLMRLHGDYLEHLKDLKEQQETLA